MDQLVGFFLHPHFLKLAKNRKNVEIPPPPHFRSAFSTAAYPDPSACLNYTLTHTPTHALILTPNFIP